MHDKHFTWGYLYGHPIHINLEEYEIEDGIRSYTKWRFTETNELADSIEMTTLVCPQCGKNSQATNGDDPCIANLPGVKAACCGHGVEEAYLVLDDDTCIRGTDDVMRKVKLLREL